MFGGWCNGICLYFDICLFDLYVLFFLCLSEFLGLLLVFVGDVLILVVCNYVVGMFFVLDGV